MGMLWIMLVISLLFGFVPYGWAEKKENFAELDPKIELVAGKDYDLSPYWALKKTAGKNFWFLLPPIGNPGVKEEAFIKESGSVLSHGPGFARPPYKISTCSPLENRPFFFHCPGRVERGIYNFQGNITYADFVKLGGKDHFLDHEDYKKWKAKYKDRFLGFWNPEWGNDLRNAYRWGNKTLLGVPLSLSDSNSKQANCKVVEAVYKLVKSGYFDDVFGLNCRFPWDHYNLEWGGRLACIEVTGWGNPSWQHQIAFARGAARQYSKPWMMYQAYFGDNGHPRAGSARNIYRLYHPPHVCGPLAGIPISLARRNAYLSYMSGANFFTPESYPYAHVQDYDNDGIYGLTKQGETLKEIFEFSQRHPDRGVAYTPIALLLDYHHGWFPRFGGTGNMGAGTWYNVPYEKGDFMIEETMKTLFPYSKLSNTPYGDIFDVLIPNPPSGTVSRKLLSGYKVLVVLGDIEIDKSLAKRLINYVGKGGTLILNASQINSNFFSEKFLGVRLGKEFKKGGNFDYLPVETLAAKKLLVDKQGRGLVTLNKFAKGNVILTTPCYCLDRKNKLLPFFPQLLAGLTREVLPFRIEGDVEYLVNKNEKGDWLITLINNKGVKKDRIMLPAGKDIIEAPKDFNPETFDLRKTATVHIHSSVPETLGNITELVTEKDILPKNKGMIEVDVPPGDVRIIKIEKEGLMKQWFFPQGPDHSLAAYWPFEEVKQGRTPDVSGNGCHARVLGAIQVEGKAGKALFLDSGKKNRIDCGNYASFDTIDKITVALWVKAASRQQNMAVLIRKMSSRKKGWKFYFTGQDFVWTVGGPSYLRHGNGFLSRYTEKWTHVAGTYDGKYQCLYINGALAGSKEAADAIITSSSNVCIGEREEMDRYFNGATDEVRIYDRALNADEIKSLFEREMKGEK